MRAFALIAAFIASAAFAQVRTIPDDAKRAKIRHVQGYVVELNGRQESLAPGAQIRDQWNRIVVPWVVPAGTLVKYRRDKSGAVREVWILTPEEAARR